MKKSLLTTLLLTAGALPFAPLAQANVLAEWSVNGGTTTTICTSPSGVPCAGLSTVNSVTIGPFLASSNSPGTPKLADVLSTTLSLVNSGATAANIILTVGDTGFLSPSGNTRLFSNVGGTTITGGPGNSLSFVSSIDEGNGQNVTPGTFNTPTLNPSIPSTVSGSFSASDNLLITGLTTPYSITELYDITLAPGATINFSASSDLRPVPEPGTFVLFGAGLLGLALLLGRRRLPNF